MENHAGAYARFFTSRGAKVVANDTVCDVHGDGVDAVVKDGAAIVEFIKFEIKVKLSRHLSYDQSPFYSILALPVYSQ